MHDLQKVGHTSWDGQPVGKPFVFLESSRALGQYLLQVARAWLGQFPSRHCHPTLSKYRVFTGGVWLRCNVQKANVCGLDGFSRPLGCMLCPVRSPRGRDASSFVAELGGRHRFLLTVHSGGRPRYTRDVLFSRAPRRHKCKKNDNSEARIFCWGGRWEFCRILQATWFSGSQGKWYMRERESGEPENVSTFNIVN